MKDFRMDLDAEEEIVMRPLILDAGRICKINVSNNAYKSWGKQVFDLFFAALVLPVIAPVIFVLWLMVRRDGGCGFYSQTRIGLDGREFRFWKLRTMVMDADRKLKAICDADPEVAREWNENQKLANDPRITKVGRLLRATSLDELPQFWNVICGEMSFVGPRPFMPAQMELYNVAGGRSYYSVRPGITGPWQVFGRGATSFADRVRYDNLYCRELNLNKDVYFLFKTVGVILRRTGS